LKLSTNIRILCFQNRAEQYRNESDLLTKKLDKSEAEVNELVQINVVRKSIDLIIE
jgi:hypothetical protein